MSHAKLFSPSKADGWFACAGRPVMEAVFPDSGSEYSQDGTARHEVCALCLLDSEPGRQITPAALVGRVMANGVAYKEDWVEEDTDYVQTIRALADGTELFVERRVDFRRFIECADPEDGFGTADAIVFKQLADNTFEMIVADRKTGYHEVPVERNKQLQLYALGAFDEFSLLFEISRVRLLVHQRGAREWDCSVEDLLAFGQEARSRAISVVNAVSMHGKVDQAEWERTFLNPDPSESACAYCKAMATCPSMQAKVQDIVGADFADLAAGEVEFNHDGASSEHLGDAMAACNVIEDWIKAVRAEVERRLLAGIAIPGFKLVLGKAGARKWTDNQAAEEMLRKTFRLPVEKAYDLSLISPTSAEKLAKAGEIGPKQWPKLQPLIGRSEPKPSVAPASDKREPYMPPNVADDFHPVADPVTDLC